MIEFIGGALGDGYFWLGLLVGMLMLTVIQQQMRRADARLAEKVKNSPPGPHGI
jgi:hypothetical protein